MEQPSHRGGVVPPLGTGTSWITEDPLAGIERRPQARDDTAPIRYEHLHALWARADVHVREKTLWRMLYETAARANEVLALDLGARCSSPTGDPTRRRDRPGKKVRVMPVWPEVRAAGRERHPKIRLQKPGERSIRQLRNPGPGRPRDAQPRVVPASSRS